jgi:hypothetical protein
MLHPPRNSSKVCRLRSAQSSATASVNLNPLAVTDFASVQKNLTAVTTAQTDFAKSSFKASKAYFEKLANVKSPDKFFELSTEYAKSAQETFVAEATKIGELYKTFAKEAFTPFTSSFLPK